MAIEKLVGGLKCSEVLAALPNYIDGSLGSDSRQAVELHVAGCSECEKFGAAYVGIIRAIRESLRQRPEDAEAVASVRRRIFE